MALGGRKRPAKGQTTQTATIPAPIGGMNTMDAGPLMPPTDSIYAYNLIASEYGLRTRLGYREWCTNLTGNVDNGVRTIMPFSGQTSGDDRLFATTDDGIWDVSSSSASPTEVVSWPSTVNDAGRCIATTFATPAGRFLIVCDEENGLYTYTASTTTWLQVQAGVTQAWAGSTTYEIGNQVVLGGNIYICDTNGVSAATGGPTGTGTNIVDGTTRWDYVGAASSTVIGASLADQQAGITCDPADFVFCTVFKNRLWFVERATTRAWYLPVGQLYGTATSIDLGARMRAGGPLVGLYNWSYDGGSGMDTLLVAISTTGDVVIYAGTDPSSATTFGLKGTWSVGGVPAGRRVATDYGGELLILSSLGVVPLSRLVSGAVTADASLYATQKVANLFSRYMQARKARGWAIHLHPTDNALMVLVPPESAGGDPMPLVMAMATKGWSQYRDLPIECGETWNGEFYFGTSDGKVCWNIDHVDAVTLADPNVWSQIEWSVMTAFQSLGNARFKRVHSMRPTILSGGTVPALQCTARYGYNLSEPSAPSTLTVSLSGAWDSGTFDAAIWGGDFTPYQPIQGGAGMGREVAIAVRGAATSRTTLVSIDVFFEQGGVL